MSKIKLRNNILVGDYEKPYFIAEFNSSHNGDLGVAKEMIDAAVESGCSCVKFQSWSEKTLYSKSYYDNNRMAKRFVKKFALDEDELLELSSYCQEKGIDFASTPYSGQEVDFLIEKGNAPFIKIASMEINNYSYLEYIGKTGHPIVLSTGMSSIDEIEKAVECIEKTGNKSICILHCVSMYPAMAEEINLNNIVTLKNRFPDYPIGYSDHTIGNEIACASIALGCGIIEKHMTLDRSKIGMDNNMATEPDDMKKLVENCLNVYTAMGSFERVVSENEMKQRLNMRRSVVSTKKLKKGHIITRDDVTTKRPGSGIPADQIEQVIGKVIVSDIDEDSMILFDNIKI